MMDDLISRSALLDELQEELDFDTPMLDEEQNKLINTGLRIAVKDVKRQPTVDAVVLPVKPGSVVWILNHRFEAEVEEICIREDGVFAVWVEYDRSPELTEVWDDGEFDIKEVGKTVFLTVEEREKAETEG